MAFEFNGDIQEISKQQLDFVGQTLKDRDFKPCKVSVEKVEHTSMVSNIKRFVVNDGKGHFKFIAKMSTSNEALRTTFNTAHHFKNEHVMYCEVLPKMQQCQTKYNMDGFRFATCFGSSEQAPHEIILLEDLNDAHFVVLNKLETMTNECVKLVLKNFAKYHALSYALKKEEPNLYEALKSSLTDVWALAENLDESLGYFAEFEKDVLTILDHEKYKKVVEGKISEIPNLNLSLKNSDADLKFSVIQQGDAWTGNIMFRFEGEKPVESVLINYQSPRSGSPIGDVFYFILNSTDYKTRSKYFNEWIDYYYSELNKALSAIGIPIDSIYPKEQLDLDMGRYSKIILGFSIYSCSIVIRKPEEIEKVKIAVENNNMAAAIESFKLSNLDSTTKALVKSHIEGLIDNYLEWGYQ